MFERNPDKPKEKVEVRVMWSEGPSRQWKRAGAGQYVCQACTLPVVGVYRVKQHGEVANLWVCGSCRDSMKPKKQAAA